MAIFAAVVVLGAAIALSGLTILRGPDSGDLVAREDRVGSSDPDRSVADSSDDLDAAPDGFDGLFGLVFCGHSEVVLHPLDGGEPVTMPLPRFDGLSDGVKIADSAVSGSTCQSRLVFDATFSRAAAIDDSPADGSTRVGYYHLGSGEFVDMSRPSQEGFSADVVKDYYPRFNPVLPEFWYKRGSDAVIADIESGEETVRKGFGERAYVFALDGSILADAGVGDLGRTDPEAGWANPSGTLYLDGSTVSDTAERDDLGGLLEGHYWDLVGGDGQSVPCGPPQLGWSSRPVWLSDAELLCVSDSGIQTYDANLSRVTLHVDQRAPARGFQRPSMPATVEPLIPQAERSNSCFTVSRDLKDFVFKSDQGSITEWYMGSIEAPGEPELIPGLSGQQECPMDWL